MPCRREIDEWSSATAARADYELAKGASSPLRPLLDYLSSGREIGFHMVATRRSPLLVPEIFVS
jgi:hypothetical protein